MSDGAPWCTIESDPGVFTELISAIGVRDVQVEELYSLDQSLFDQIQPVYGLVFLFKWRNDDTRESRPSVVDYDPSQLFFARQVITNACATQAILSVLLNAKNIELGAELSQFKEFTQSFDAEMRGLAISNSPVIRNVHNGFARPEPFITKKEYSSSGDEDVYHFISYLPVNGHLYELDGLKEGPIFHGECTDENWLSLVQPVIQQRIQRYSESEIRFNLMAIIANRSTIYQRQIEELAARKLSLTSSEDSSMDVENPENVRQIQLIDAEIEELNGKIAAEEAKFKRWRVENTRRKHNYIPFIVNLLKLLADKGELVPLIERAKANPQTTK